LQASSPAPQPRVSIGRAVSYDSPAVFLEEPVQLGPLARSQDHLADDEFRPLTLRREDDAHRSRRAAIQTGDLRFGLLQCGIDPIRKRFNNAARPEHLRIFGLTGRRSEHHNVQ
jgi:hypothetical protein